MVKSDRQVDLRLLHAFYFAHRPYAALERSAAALAVHGLLRPTASFEAQPWAWRFANQLERDIVYGLMPAGQRRRLHIRLARVCACAR